MYAFDIRVYDPDEEFEEQGIVCAANMQEALARLLNQFPNLEEVKLTELYNDVENMIFVDSITYDNLMTEGMDYFCHGR